MGKKLVILHGTDTGSLQIRIKIIINKMILIVQFSAYSNAHILREIPAELNQNCIPIFSVCRIISFVRVQDRILDQFLYLSGGCKSAESN